MVEKCDGCEFDDIEFEIINGNQKDKYCRDCAEESIFELLMSNNKISFEIKDKEGNPEIKVIIVS